MNQPDQNQHRIPQVYLRLWSFKGRGNADTVCVMKQGDPVSHHKLVKRFTTEKNLFDTTLHDEGFERFFDEKCKYVETNYPKVVSTLRSGTYNGQSRIFLTEFMSNIFVRQRSTFELLTSIIKRTHLRAKLLNEISILENQDNPKLIKAVYEEMIIDPDHSIDSKVSAVILQAWKHFNKVLSRFNHVILEAPSDRWWGTSDNPVTTTNTGKDGWLLGPESEVYFPISKEYLVYMHAKEMHSENTLTRYSNDIVTKISHQVFEDLANYLIQKNRADYFILGEDIGYFNARNDEFEKRYLPLDSRESHELRKEFSFMNTLLPPNLADPDLELLLNKMDAEFDPIELNVETDSDAIENECIAAVDKMIRLYGGKRILGWQIWKGPYLIEAEFHAIWETPNEELKDVSFKRNKVSKIVFVEDSRLVYNGRQINNVRLSLTKNSLVNDFIEVCDIQFKLLNKGKRAELYGQELMDALTDSHKKNVQYLNDLRALIWQLLDDGGNEDSQCPCLKGRKYKNCHGRNIHALWHLD